jgi:hypothetical protein
MGVNFHDVQWKNDHRCFLLPDFSVLWEILVKIGKYFRFLPGAIFQHAVVLGGPQLWLRESGQM